MARILVNGFSAKAGGGRAIFRNYLALLVDRAPTHGDHYLVLSAIPGEDRELVRQCSHVIVVEVPTLFRFPIMLPLFYFWWLDRMIRRNRIQAVLNFADIILPVRAAQVYFFDWSYAVYPESEVWARMTWLDRWVRRIKLALIRATWRHATIIIAQTETMARRLRELYGLRRVEVIASPVTLESLRPAEGTSFALPPTKPRLLCLANYAPHKNVEVFLPLARRLRSYHQGFVIVTTLDPCLGPVADLLRQAAEEGLTEHWVNIGRIEPSAVPALFAQCQALLLPTLLESYGLPFVEAMQHGVTILTSDFDFSRDVCGEAAFYFDPMDAVSIHQTLVEAFSDEAERRRRIECGFQRVRQLPDWPTAFSFYQECIDKVLGRT